MLQTHPITRSQKPVVDTTTDQQIPSNRGELSRICGIFGAGGSLDDEIKHLDRLFSECVASKLRHKDLQLSPDEAPRPQVLSLHHDHYNQGLWLPSGKLT